MQSDGRTIFHVDETVSRRKKETRRSSLWWAGNVSQLIGVVSWSHWKLSGYTYIIGSID
jgi:hypothetical protein